MPLIEQGETMHFYSILRSGRLLETDFERQEINTADPKSDQIDPLQGYVRVLRKSTHIAKDYPLQCDVAWVLRLKKDLDGGRFG